MNVEKILQQVLSLLLAAFTLKLFKYQKQKKLEKNPTKIAKEGKNTR